jgi:signal peptidase II
VKPVAPSWPFWLAAVAVFAADRVVKGLFLDGWQFASDCITLSLVFNKGVAFSMLTFLGPWLKWLQVGLIAVVLTVAWWEGWLKRDGFAIGLLAGAGASNVLDRFLYGGVVDYFYWHCGFDFAIFNLADVMIDLGVLLILLRHLRKKQ